MSCPPRPSHHSRPGIPKIPPGDHTPMSSPGTLGTSAADGSKNVVGYGRGVPVALVVEAGPLGAGCQHDEPQDPAHDGVDDKLGCGAWRELTTVEGGLDDGLAGAEAGVDDVLDHGVELRRVLSGPDSQP